MLEFAATVRSDARFTRSRMDLVDPGAAGRNRGDSPGAGESR
jgi:hypothetical protein